MTYEIERIRDNVNRVNERIAAAAEKSGRGRGDIFFCAASKTRPAQLLAQCAGLDFDAYGENRAQELRDKLGQSAYTSKPVHFIGRLQTNKVKEIVGKAALIHSVDSLHLLEAIHRSAVKSGLVQEVLIQINVGGEGSKGGIAPEALADFLSQCPQYGGIRVRGLMAIPPNTLDLGESRKNLQKMHQLFVDSTGKTYDNVIMDILSMGMSGDFEEAILCGSTLVRIGSALFGTRDL